MATEPSAIVKQDFTSDETHGEFDDFWAVIVGHLRLVLAITVAGMICAIVYFAYVPNMYTANTKILAEKTESGQQRPYPEMMMPQVSADEQYYGTQVSILTGQPIREKVAAALGAIPGPYELEAKRMKNTRIILLSITHGDPEWAAKIANKFAEIYVRESTKESQFISRQVLDLIPSEQELVEGKGISGGNSSGFDKQEFAGSLAASRDPDLEKLRSEKLALESQRKELSQRYLPQHPSIRELIERLTYLDAEIKQRVQKIVSNLRASLGGEIKITNIRVLEVAAVPTKPSKPNRTLGIFIATFISFIMGSFLVLVMDYTNQKIVTEEHVHKFVNLPFLGYVPLVKELHRNKKLKSGGGGPADKVPSVIDALAANSRLLDAMASVRTHVLFSMPYEKSKRIMITSCIPDEGKSTVSALLAMSLASLGKKILLVDADLRRPFLHAHLGVKNQKGLTDFLVGSATLDEITIHLSGTNLSLITGGTISPNPSELLSSERFGEFLDQISEGFDRVIIDVPPVLFIPDGLIVAKYIHSGILVCGSGMVERSVAKTVKEKFDAISHPLIGVVINRMNYEAESYKYKHYGNYKKYYSRKK